MQVTLARCLGRLAIWLLAKDLDDHASAPDGGVGRLRNRETKMFFTPVKPSLAKSLLPMIFALAIYLVSCGFHPSPRPTSGNTPEQMFEALIQSPLPTEVTNLEGTGDTWQGHSIYLRFQVEPAFLEAYMGDNFESVPCDAIFSYFELPNPTYDVFSPSWKPEDVTGGICYRSKGFLGETWLGEQFILWDSVTNSVYFYGVGG